MVPRPHGHQESPASMPSHITRHFIPAALLVMIIVSAFFAPEAGARTYSARSKHAPSARVGDTITNGYARVLVPSRGHMNCATMDLMGFNRTAEQTLCVGNSNGRATISTSHAPHPQHSARVITGRSIAECADSTYRVWGYTWQSTYYLRYNTLGTPGNIGASEVKNDIVASAANWDHNSNTCGDTRTPRTLNVGWLGYSTATPNISPTTYTCGTPDSISVIHFGPLPASRTEVVFGATCTRVDYSTARPRIIAADIRLNNSSLIAWNTTGEKPVICATCVWTPNVENVLTHEQGHAIGIDHPTYDPTLHPSQTMGYSTNQNYSRENTTLGTGDRAALFTLYGVL